MDDLRPKLATELVSFPYQQWRSSQARSQPAAPSVRWIQAATLKPIAEAPVLELGLTQSGHWVASAADGSVIDIEAAKNYLPLFPLLELPYEDVRENLMREFSARGLNQAWLTVFPFEGLVAGALTSGSKFWPELALRWVDRMEASELIRDALNFLMKEGKTQEQRHQARRLLGKSGDPG